MCGSSWLTVRNDVQTKDTFELGQRFLRRIHGFWQLAIRKQWQDSIQSKREKESLSKSWRDDTRAKNKIKEQNEHAASFSVIFICNRILVSISSILQTKPIAERWFVLRRFSVARFDAAGNRFRLCGGCFAQTPLCRCSNEFDPGGQSLSAKRGTEFSTFQV